MRKPFFILVCLFVVLSCRASSEEQPKSQKHVYVIHLGKNDNDNEGNATNSHLGILAQVLGSMEEASKAMTSSHKPEFNGFAARLKVSQAKELEGLPNVVRVIRDGSLEMHTTRSVDHMGLTLEPPSDLYQRTNMGEGMIIGMIDTGIWPEAMAFGDEGLGPIPPKWKGKCVSGDTFDGAKHCNKKLIGAQVFKETAELNGMQVDPDEYLSPRDGSQQGHGTHMASVAAGTFVNNVSFFELGLGTARGVAPKARIAVYKACWKSNGYPICDPKDVHNAFVQAVQDGVDVILAAFGRNYFPYDYLPMGIANSFNAYSQGSYHATASGIPVIASGGNSGPQAHTVVNTEAWMLTVGSSTIDRSFPTPIALGDNTTVMGQAFMPTQTNGFLDIVIPNTKCEQYTGIGTEFPTEWLGKIMLCFCRDSNVNIGLVVEYLRTLKVAGVIYARKSDDQLYRPHFHDIFTLEVDYATGTQIYKYILLSKDPKVMIGPSITAVGKGVPTTVASFSSRGPITSSDFGAGILKPDLIAPGANIIGSAPEHVDNYQGYTINSGTSISAAHVAGVMALVRCIHPDWSPAALKSAFMTTAKPKENGFPLRAAGSPGKPADPFDMGSGVIDPNRVTDPGLIYNISMPEYTAYLCAITIDTQGVDGFTNGQNVCNYEEGKWPRPFDINLPSIAIPSLSDSVVLTRTVTNVGPVDSIYKPKIESPVATKVTVNPQELRFNAATSVIKFEVTIEVTKQVNLEYTFGSLVWSDGVHDVRIPIAVKVHSLKISCDEGGLSC